MEDSLVQTGMGVRGWGDVRSVITRVLTRLLSSRGGITEQIDEGIRFFARKYKGQRYLAYFQAYSNTYASLDVLKLRYEEAFGSSDDFGIGDRDTAGCGERGNFGLSGRVGSRRYYVCVEYGWSLRMILFYGR